jgi:hypothetical protein
MPLDSEIKVFADRFGRPEWRVEYTDDDGTCYVRIFAGPDAERRARDYHAALKSGMLEPIHPDHWAWPSVQSAFLCSPAHRACRGLPTLLTIEGHPAPSLTNRRRP